MELALLSGKRILFIVSGGIAAYKCLEVIRRLRERGIAVRCILTKGGSQFVTPLSLAAISGDRVFDDLFSLNDENEIGHIRLSREADLVVVAPASADILAKMAHGLADDLATTALLATDKPVLVAPAMNPRMWEHPATRANVATLEARGIIRIGPGIGEMAESNEAGEGRLADPPDIVAAIVSYLEGAPIAQGRLSGLSALVTSGPTFEPIDPVRYIANRSSGKQGHAIARALSNMGADTSLVTGPTQLPDPTGVRVTHIETARQMLEACEAALPVDVAVCAAAVGDWRVGETAKNKIKKDGKNTTPTLDLTENPDILASLGQSKQRPRLLIGFAAETEQVVENAIAKRTKKNCDWILANDVSPETGTFGGDDNTLHLITSEGVEDWPRLGKQAAADKLAGHIADAMEKLA
jgi:phosphopantothenoylcysteine decarboxylase / phosphopantothenate---cysteine ligase